jgi:hypothetical protein
MFWPIHIKNFKIIHRLIRFSIRQRALYIAAGIFMTLAAADGHDEQRVQLEPASRPKASFVAA